MPTQLIWELPRDVTLSDHDLCRFQGLSPFKPEQRKTTFAPNCVEQDRKKAGVFSATFRIVILSSGIHPPRFNKAFLAQQKLSAMAQL